MPEPALKEAEQFETVPLFPALIPLPVFWYAEQFRISVPAPTLMPWLALNAASMPSTRQVIVAAGAPSTRQLSVAAVARSMPSWPQARTEPLITVMLDWMAAVVTLTPSTEP